MSAFGNYQRDDIVGEIKALFDDIHEKYPEKSISEIVEEVQEVVGYGITSGIYRIEQKKYKNKKQ